MQAQDTKVKVADLVAETLENLGIQHAFGIIGAGNIHLFEAITRRGYTEIVCVHHEQAACMAVQTYYRTNGRLAAALLTTGAGSTNGITGVVSAWADSIPCIVIAGNENSKFTFPENPLRMWGVQGYDSCQMVERVSKYQHRVMQGAQAQYELQKAVHIALDGRPGPTWIEIPLDVQSQRIERDAIPRFEAPAATDYLSDAVAAQVDSVLAALLKAERPLLWLGNGIRLAGAETRLAPLLEKLGAPALVSWAGIDMIDSSHPLVFGRAGVYGQRAANFIVQNCDYLLAIGTRLAIPQIGYDLSELARLARIDVVDIDADEVVKHAKRTQENILCDARVFIEALIARLEALTAPVPSKAAWLETCRAYEQQFPWVGPEHADKDGFMNSYRFMQRLNDFFKPDQVVVTDMGTALLSGHQVLRFKEGQRFMTSTGLGEMGYGLPAALGVSFANDRGEVMCLNCDGGMMMNLQELQTMVHHKLPIKLFIFNNDGYLMIKHAQKAVFKESAYVGTDRASGVSCPDFSKLATAFDIPSYQIRTWEECDATLEAVQAATGPVICEVFMSPTQLFSPKLGLQARADGSLVSPPLEDLAPLLPREVLDKAMIGGMHEKSKSL
ncbi:MULTISPECIES: thiamine pyrophosphate-binding protein [unclassified Duganella]|uniref:thiamine pyrophosphate-binding protein n=1 Tax=unclassified Duganella TaxID=2636909 RepID=UPI000E34C91B|nr:MULTISPECIES: thiamine pyrophosphate-binding protein [unclassified Duganella]RFP08070.1 thiamine pyrophosphate-binding protein [Duganella sp. BJB475]RFP23875.1 thiamine pyrophosphate-binding protein [Duganella sp. BJB476]